MNARDHKRIQDRLSLAKRWGWTTKRGKFITWNTRSKTHVVGGPVTVGVDLATSKDLTMVVTRYGLPHAGYEGAAVRRAFFVDTDTQRELKAWWEKWRREDEGRRRAERIDALLKEIQAETTLVSDAYVNYIRAVDAEFAANAFIGNERWIGADANGDPIIEFGNECWGPTLDEMLGAARRTIRGGRGMLNEVALAAKAVCEEARGVGKSPTGAVFEDEPRAEVVSVEEIAPIEPERWAIFGGRRLGKSWVKEQLIKVWKEKGLIK